MRIQRLLAPLFVIGFLAVPAFAADTIESVEKQIIEQNDKVRSMSAKMTSKTDAEMAGNKMSQTVEGTIEIARHGDLTKMRVDVKQSMQQGEMKMDGTVLMVSDGTAVYMLAEQMGMKQCMKTKPDASSGLQVTAKSIFENLRKQEFTLKLAADEAIDGKPTWTVEATPKDAAANPLGVAKLTLNFTKDNGMFVRQLGLDKDGKQIQSTTFTDIKLNPEFAPDRFEFKVPEGVTVTDMTGGAPSAPATGTEEKK